MEPAHVWTECSARLQDELPSEEFTTWIGPLQAGLRNEVLVVLAPNTYVRDTVRRSYRDQIAKIVEGMGDEAGVDRIEFEVGELDARPPVPLKAGRREGSRRRYNGADHLNPGYHFDSFVVGKNNRIAEAAARHVAEAPGTSYSPLLLYGDVGLGKTHLMQAVGKEILLKDPGTRVRYLNSHRFVNDMVEALKGGSMGEMTNGYRDVDVLLLDDIQFFGEKVRSQEEFFHIFNLLQETGSQIVLTSDRYPSEIEGLEERLKSRFAGGMTAEMGHPDLETRAAILCKKAEHAGVVLTKEVAFYVAERIRSNVRELEGALQRVIAGAKFNGTPVTRESVDDALGDLFARRARQLSVDEIQKVVATYYNIKRSDLLAHRRTRTVARPRQIAMFLAREFTSHSLLEIGTQFNGRDHSTVLHACRRVAELRQEFADVDEDVANLVRQLSK